MQLAEKRTLSYGSFEDCGTCIERQSSIMPTWLIYLVAVIAVMAGWVVLGRAIVRGELRTKGGGALRRSEHPVAFWLSVGAMFSGGLVFLVVVFVIA